MNVCLLVAVACCAPPVPQGETAEALTQRLDGHLSRLAALGFSGAVAVARDGEVEFARGYGLAVRSRDRQVTADTVFPLGSITKHFTAAAVLALQMEGKIATTDPVGRHLTELEGRLAEVTLHQLLSHTSGLPEAASHVEAATDVADFVRRAARTELAFAPGSGFGYSNIGYGLLAAVVERVAGVSFEQYLRRALWQPAGMHDTGMHLPEWEPGRLAHGYIEGTDTGTLLDAGPIGWGLIGAGGVMATVVDLARWGAVLDGGRVLDAPSLQAMTAHHATVRPGVHIGYGCVVRDGARPRISHNGSNDVFSADFRHYPDQRVTIVVAGNHADVYAFDVSPDVEQLVFDEPVTALPQIISLSPPALAAYGGSWVLPDGATVEVAASDGALQLSSRDAAACGLLHPVRDEQTARLAELQLQSRDAMRAAVDGDLAPLHALTDRHAPIDHFAARHRGLLQRWQNAIGDVREIRALPGAHRFGEIAIVLTLVGERGVRRIEYCFGDDEVGSIRILEADPPRVARPESAVSFVDYNVRRRTAWRVSFELDENGTPVALVLGDGDARRRARRAETR